MNARETAENILRAAGLGADPEAARAKRFLDMRLDGLGLGPSTGLPTRLEPGARSVASGVVALLGDPRGAPPPHVEIPTDIDGLDEESEALFEPSQLIAAQAVTGLAATSAGGTQVNFSDKGVVHVGSGAVGAYWNRALGAAQNIKWAPLAPGLLLPFDPRVGLFVGTNAVGGITIGGVLTLAFYKLPPIKSRAEREQAKIDAQRGAAGGEPGSPWAGGGGDRYRGVDLTAPERVWTPGSFRLELGKRVMASGSDMVAGISSGPGNGTDVSLGSFSDAGAGTQIYKVGTNFPVAGAGAIGAVILNALPSNTDTIWVAETAALAVASNGAIGASGQDTWNRPLNGTLFMLALSGTQVLGARYRS